MKVNKPYSRICDRILYDCRITPLQRNILWVLCSHAYGDKTDAFPSQDKIAKMCGVRSETVCRNIATLANYGYIKVIKQGIKKLNVHEITIFETEETESFIKNAKARLQESESKDFQRRKHPKSAKTHRRRVKSGGAGDSELILESTQTDKWIDSAINSNLSLESGKAVQTNQNNQNMNQEKKQLSSPSKEDGSPACADGRDFAEGDTMEEIATHTTVFPKESDMHKNEGSMMQTNEETSEVLRADSPVPKDTYAPPKAVTGATPVEPKSKRKRNKQERLPLQDALSKRYQEIQQEGKSLENPDAPGDVHPEDVTTNELVKQFIEALQSGDVSNEPELFDDTDVSDPVVLEFRRHCAYKELLGYLDDPALACQYGWNSQNPNERRMGYYHFLKAREQFYPDDAHKFINDTMKGKCYDESTAQ